MPFHSTRTKIQTNASNAVIKGLADDGGLFVPNDFVSLDYKKLKELVNFSYTDRAKFILKYFLDDFNKNEISNIVDVAYLNNKFDNNLVAPVNKVANNTFVLELFHGPTNAFKDIALQILPHLLSEALHKNNFKNNIAILVATSGDTGKAALEGFKNIDKLSCTVLYPKNGVSDMQELQMLTTNGNNTFVYGYEGNFDDTQNCVKRLFLDNTFRQTLLNKNIAVSSANSINIGRLLPQIVYYFSAYADLVKINAINIGDAVNFAVPTGNFGNILAAYYAKTMGLPIKKLISASNKNKILSDFFKTGVYNTRRPFYKTISPSMDILISSNLERLLYEVCNRDSDAIQKLMLDLKTNGSFKIEKKYLDRLNNIFYAYYADDNQTKAEIKCMFEQKNYLMDTHTAVASYVLNRYKNETGDNTPCVLVSTASPYKFAKDVLSALTPNIDFNFVSSFEYAKALSSLTQTDIPKNILNLVNLPLIHNKICNDENIANTIINQ